MTDLSALSPSARPHIRRRIIERALMQHQPAGWSGDEKKPYKCSCGQLYAMGKKGDGLAVHQAEKIQQQLDAPRRSG